MLKTLPLPKLKEGAAPARGTDLSRASSARLLADYPRDARGVASDEPRDTRGVAATRHTPAKYPRPLPRPLRLRDVLERARSDGVSGSRPLRRREAAPTPRRRTPPAGEKKMTIDEVIAALDVDGDGVIDVDEWIAQLERIPLLKNQLEKYVDPATGLIDPAKGEPAAAVTPAPVEPAPAPAA